MPTVVVKITETLEKEIVFNGVESIEAALDVIRREYKNQSIVLNSDDFTCVSFTAEILKRNAN